MGQLIAFLSLGSYNKIINYHLILWRARIMNEELFNEATKSNVLTKKLIDQLLESMTYSSISFINWTIETLSLIKARLQRGDRITDEVSGEVYTLHSFREFVEKHFSSYNKTYAWISSLSKRFSLVEMIATGIVYVKDTRTDTYQPFISGTGKYCRYDKEKGILVEI